MLVPLINASEYFVGDNQSWSILSFIDQMLWYNVTFEMFSHCVI